MSAAKISCVSARKVGCSARKRAVVARIWSECAIISGESARMDVRCKNIVFIRKKSGMFRKNVSSSRKNMERMRKNIGWTRKNACTLQKYPVYPKEKWDVPQECEQ